MSIYIFRSGSWVKDKKGISKYLEPKINLNIENYQGEFHMPSWVSKFLKGSNLWNELQLTIILKEMISFSEKDT